MHKKTLEPAANLGDRVVGWFCIPALVVFSALHFAGVVGV